jgi:magnesium transporter
MPMLSNLLRRAVHDSHGGRMRLIDLVVNLATGPDYPEVTHFVLKPTGDSETQYVPWERARWLVQGHHAPRMQELGKRIEADSLGSSVCLARDVLDAQVLDLLHMQATRANDLWLEVNDDRLKLRAVDVSPWAVLRRLGPGWLSLERGANLLDWQQVEFLRGDTRAASAGSDYNRRVALLQPVQIARLVDELPYLHATELVRLLPGPLATDTLEAMSAERQVQVFEELDEPYATGLLALMAPDRAAQLVSHLSPDVVERSLNALPPQLREQILELLRYPDDVAGGNMTNDVVTVASEISVADARKILRDRLRSPDFVYFLYAVENDTTNRLQGVISLRDFIVAEDRQRIEEIMRPFVVTIDPLEPALDAARKVADHGLAALPVVARDGRLLGALTLDAALTQLAPAWRMEVPRVFS